MKNIFKYIGIVGICLFSFYYTEKIALYVKMKNPIMKEINDIKDSLYVNSEDCSLIDSMYIIPGLNGKEVDVNKSFNNMKDLMVFDNDNIIYKQVSPSISLENNKNRIIIRGNEKKNSVSFIFESVNKLSKYMLDNDYKVNLLIDKEYYDLDYELINNAKNENTYKRIDKFLNKNKINKELCYVKNNISSLCSGKYLFKTSLIVNHSNLSSVVKKIRSGEIILVQDSLSITEMEYLINQIKYQDLEIVPLSILVSETI